MATVSKTQARTPKQARPTGEPVDAQAAVDRCMKTFPRVMARLAE